MDQMTDSISEWLGRLKDGEVEAAQNLWNRYSAKLIRIAKQRLSGSPRGVADEEDVALSVFGSIFRGAANGRFEKISTRDDLWWLLLSITKRKAVDHIRREAAQKRRLKGDRIESRIGIDADRAWPYSLDDLVGKSPPPDFLVALDEQYLRLLNMLRNDQLREIATLRIEGYAVGEIALKMNIGQRAVERKLRLIRDKWKRELLNPDRTK
jgi:RNA polymerase sigma factor (sigma-70 family)